MVKEGIRHLPSSKFGEWLAPSTLKVALLASVLLATTSSSSALPTTAASQPPSCKTTGCSSGEFCDGNQCRTCFNLNPNICLNHLMTFHGCTSDQDAHCGGCPYGSYQYWNNKQKGCLLCSTCEPGQVQVWPCTPWRNTVCRSVATSTSPLTGTRSSTQSSTVPRTTQSAQGVMTTKYGTLPTTRVQPTFETTPLTRPASRVRGDMPSSLHPTNKSQPPSPATLTAQGVEAIISPTTMVLVTPDHERGSSSLSDSTITAIIVPAGICIVLAAVLLWCRHRRQKNNQEKHKKTASKPEGDQEGGNDKPADHRVQVEEDLPEDNVKDTPHVPCEITPNTTLSRQTSKAHRGEKNEKEERMSHEETDSATV